MNGIKIRTALQFSSVALYTRPLIPHLCGLLDVSALLPRKSLWGEIIHVALITFCICLGDELIISGYNFVLI